MPRKPLPPSVLELRGAYIRHPERRPPEPAECLPVTLLAEARISVVEPCPPSVRDPRGLKLWEETCQRMVELGTLHRDLLRPLERYVLLNVAMWAAAEAERPLRAALFRELSSLEAKLLGPPPATSGTSKPRALRPGNRFAQFRNDPDEALRKSDPKAWTEKCRRAASEALKLADRLRFRPDERRKLLERRKS
jgi:hypothetical protein